MKIWVRRTIGLVGAALILWLVAWGVYRAYGPGSFDERLAKFERRWSAYTTGPDAAVNWKFILTGLGISLQIAAISIVLSLIFGILLALMRLARHPRMSPLLPAPALMAIAAPAAVVVQAVRASPLYMIILYTFLAAPKFGLNLSPKNAGITALTLYTSCVLAELVRAGILSLDRGQFEASLSLGLGYFNRLRLVILPQGLRRMVPAVVSQLVTLIKDTSLLAFITVLEVYRRLQILSQQKYNPIESFLIAGLLYFIVNFTLATLARRLELSPGRIGGAGQAAIQGVGEEDQVRVIEHPVR